ncbi:MAG: Fic family protein [Clostridia bacterium]|nr:Fic family protein [Clostridia bacterium]
MIKYPPYEITEKILEYVGKISEKVGEIKAFEQLNRRPELRRANRINSIHSSLAIENNKLSKDEVKDVIEGKTVIGDKKDIQEVKNAYKAYNEISKINPFKIDELKRIHEIMTFLVIDDNGKFRDHGEAVYDGEEVIFMAPPEDMVDPLMKNLFEWVDEVKDKLNPLIYSSIFHYEFVFIHPFSDGNGRMARLWQSVFLTKWRNIFEYIPIESMIKKYQEDYYKAISDCNLEGKSTKFIEFMLRMIDESLENVRLTSNEDNNTVDLNDNEKEVYNYIKNNKSVTSNDVARYIGKTVRTARRILSSLIEKEKIEWVGTSLKDKNLKYKTKD